MATKQEKVLLITFGLIVGMSVEGIIRSNNIPEVVEAVEPIVIEVTVEPTTTPTVAPTQAQSQVVSNAYKLISKRYPQSPFLVGDRLERAYEQLDKDDNKFKIYIAIAGNESAFGESALAKNCNNYWGYLYTGTAKRGCYSKHWTTPDKAMDRFIELEGNKWLTKFDGSRKSLDLYDSNHGNYCGKQDDCENWKKNIWWFINQL
jgi:hypothetical protein